MTARLVVRGTCFDLHFCEVVSESRARLGLIVPKRLARKASLRNAIKRQGREAFRLAAAGVASCDLVLRLKRPIAGFEAGVEAQRRMWRTEIETLLQRLPVRR